MFEDNFDTLKTHGESSTTARPATTASTTTSFKYTRSGRLDTSLSFAQQYGRFEARIKLPVGQGMWPAFWLMPRTSACWPTAGEIDIIEYTVDFPNTLNGNYHYGPSCNNLHTSAGCGTTGTAATWTPTFISWLYDGSVYYILSSAQWAPSAFFFIPKDPFYFILNLAVGGDWPGSPNATTVFPQRMYVDYVRAYKRT